MYLGGHMGIGCLGMSSACVEYIINTMKNIRLGQEITLHLLRGE